VGRTKRTRDAATPAGAEDGQVPTPLPAPRPGEFSDEITAVRSGEAAGLPRIRALEVSGPIITKEAARTTIPSALFVVGAGPAPVPGRDDDARVVEARELFGEFVKLRRTCGESTDDLSRDHFVQALLHKAAELRAAGASEVRFRLVFDNGKAAVRYKRV
jgi:predicted secreted protein